MAARALNKLSHTRVAKLKLAGSNADAGGLRLVDDQRGDKLKGKITEVRNRTAGSPVGYKLSAQKMEKDIDITRDVGVDDIVLEGRGDGTGAAPITFRDTISAPTELARARRHIDRSERKDATLDITDGHHKADLAGVVYGGVT